MRHYTHALMHWLPIGIATIGLSLLVCAVTQQNYRLSANDPQIALAEDGARALAAGAVPADVVPHAQLFDASKSLSTFVAVFDKNGMPLESSASIENNTPHPPLGVFDAARMLGENRVTWQPNATTRIALVIVPVPDASGYFVAAGRNLREIEVREDMLLGMTLIAMSGILFVTLAIALFHAYRKHRVVEK